MKTYKKLLKESIMSDEANIKVKMNAAAGVIMRENEDGCKQVLIIQRVADDHWPHHWEFPRGKCDHGKSEDVNVCVKREIKEDTIKHFYNARKAHIRNGLKKYAQWSCSRREQTISQQNDG